MDGQITLWNFNKKQPEKFKIKNKIRLIELFGGVGSQAMALRELGADFEHYRLVEFDKYPIASYNEIHNTNFEPMDIKTIKGLDLQIIDVKSFTYLLTYSFPCQDLSVAGKQRGMEKGSGTRSGLLWEVERLLEECDTLTKMDPDTYGLPQVLIMENVPQVHSKAKPKLKDENGKLLKDENGNQLYGTSNLENFQIWLRFLESKGYKNYWQDLNAKDYGVAQNRNRCFCVSILGNYAYEFPNAIELNKCMADYLDDDVEEKFYIKNDRADALIRQLIADGRLE